MGMVVVTAQLPFDALIVWALYAHPCGECGISCGECYALAHARIELTYPQKRTFNHTPMTDHCNPLSVVSHDNGV